MNAICVIAPYKYEGWWVFDDARVGLVQEPFVDGANQMIDRLVEHIPNAENGFRAMFSGGPFPGYQDKLVWVRSEMSGNVYRSELLGMEGWLCPALLKYFNEAPPEIYIAVSSK